VSYNLLEEPWIPVLWKDGHSSRVGIIDALEGAGDIRCIALASPLDLFAVHRFMLTLLYWKASLAEGVERVRESLLNDQRIPSALLDAIKKETHRFDLFDDESPLLQDPLVRAEKNDERKSAGSLFAELATGTNIAHFHHGDDDNLRLCRPCAALGMLRVVPWTQFGGAGLSASVHNAPPIMALGIGGSLALTLGLNLVPLGGQPGEARWSGRFKPSDPTRPIPYLEALTWNPRHILLPDPSPGTCWYCGQGEVPTVGPGIVYLKNEHTKTIKKGGKSIPFRWTDPAAFYTDDDYKTVKSVNEHDATDNRDLRWLAGARSLVVAANERHRGWMLIVPCTNPANNKTFDHRLIEADSLSLEAGSGIVPPTQPPRQVPPQKGVDGWDSPKPGAPPGIRRFVNAAEKLLTDGDWVALSNAAYRDMHDSPAAFDVFASLYWGLRDRKMGRLPSRNVAWLTLKLMAAVPARMRSIRAGARFSPLDVASTLPKRQLKERDRISLYPVSFPRGERLEAALRDALEGNMRKRSPATVDWAGLCHGLNQLLD
jgi:hypothetical protein